MIDVLHDQSPAGMSYVVQSKAWKYGLGCPSPRIFFFFSVVESPGKTPVTRPRKPTLIAAVPSNSSGLSEMLHFRSTVVAQLFQSQLKRPLTRRAAVQAAPAASAGFSSGAADGRSAGGGRASAGWSLPAQSTRRQGGRQFCTKGDGQNDAAKDSEK